MSTAEKKTGQLGSWANLVICGGLSWGVNFWHATHATSGNAKVGVALALLCATGPVFSAGFASHNMSRSGGGSFKKFLTYLVFGMGMALSITAQAEAVTAVFGNIYLGVTFALMLDLSAFMSLHSIMSAEAAEASAGASDERLPERPAGVRTDASGASAPASVAPSVNRPAQRLPDAHQTRPADDRQTLAGPSAQTMAQTPQSRPQTTARKTRPAAAAAPKKSAKSPRETARELLKANPDMAAADLAERLGKARNSGHVRTMKSELLAELRDAGEIPSVRAIGA